MLYSILIKSIDRLEVLDYDLSENEVEFALNEYLLQYPLEDIRVVKEIRFEAEILSENYDEDVEPTYVVRRIFYDEHD